MIITPFERVANYYETDQMAIIHHSNYIRWFEECRIDYMEKMGFSYKRLEEAGVMIPVLEVGCTYKSMVRFGDTVVIQPQITKYTGTRLDVAYQVYDKASGELRTTGFSRHCFMSRKDNRVISLKKFLPEAHEAFCASME
jgi:acyl-CoA thioester hydrolase